MSKTSAYLIIEASRRRGYPDPITGLTPVDSSRVIAARANRPAQLKRDQIAVKVTIDVPDSAFNPVTPTAVVTIPEGLALRGPIEVDATDANAPEEAQT